MGDVVNMNGDVIISGTSEEQVTDDDRVKRRCDW